ncbi:ATP-binding protein [Actinoplanes sp. NPDC023714]|uniref:ATP-binding protein n=1 Tax=Actinoplanes sp. NPDC023714 TaxID=3154322 RepID=UPI0033C3EF92
MGVRPPFLFDAGPAPVSVLREIDHDLTVVAVRGQWSSPLWRQVTLTLRKCLTGHPGGLIIDLTELTDEPARSIPTWLNVRHRGEEMQPPVPVVLCVPPGPGLARRLEVFGRQLPVHPDTDAARRAVVDLSAQADLVRVTLDSGPRSPAEARRLVTRLCDGWDLPDVAYPAQLVVSELVSNVVEHVGGPARLMVARRDRGLHMTVADRSRVMPRPTGPVPRLSAPALSEGGRGLQLIHSLATAWGAMPIRGGKVVWAIVR